MVIIKTDQTPPGNRGHHDPKSGTLTLVCVCGGGGGGGGGGEGELIHFHGRQLCQNWFAPFRKGVKK